MPRAASLAAKLEKKTGVKPTLIKGKSGVFDVVVDGNLVFSKHQTGRFPDEDSLVAQIAGGG